MKDNCSTFAYVMTEEPQEFWKDALRVTGSEKMDRNCAPNGFSDTPGDAYRRQSAWKKDLPVSRYVHIPSAVLPTRLIDEHVQVAKRRKLTKRSADENDAWQRNEVKRTKLLENLAAIGRNTKEFESRASSVQATEPGGLQRFPNVSDILNSTVPEAFRGDVSRYDRCSAWEGVEQVEESSGRFVRTSSRIGPTSAGNLSAKENLATYGHNVKTAHSPSQTSSDLNVNSEYLEPAVNEKSFSTASSSSQPGHRSFATAGQLLSSPLQSSCRETFCTIKPPLDENYCNVRNSGNLSLAYSASPFETSIDLINRTEHKELDGKSCAANLDDSQPGLPAKIEVPDDKGLMGDKDWTVGMPFYVDESRRTMHTHGQERDAEFPKHAVLYSDTEDCLKQIETPNWRSYTFNGHQLSARNLSLTKLTETYRRKSRLESGPENENDSVTGRRRQIFQNRNQSSEFDYATPLLLLLLPSETPAATDSMTSTDDLPPGVRAGAGDGTSDGDDDLSTGTRLGTREGAALIGDDGGTKISRNGNHLEPLDRRAIITNPSPALKSNVGGVDFGSLKAITAFYRAMGKVEAPNSSSSSNRGGRAAGDTYRRPIEDPIDLSTRVQNPQHPVYDDDDKSGNGNDYLTSYADGFSDKSITNISERAGFQRPAHNITSFGEEEKPGGIPRNGSPITDLASPVKGPDDRRLPSGPASRPPAVKDSSPTSDSHLPPKKRRFQSYYDLEDTAESKSATGGNDDEERGGTWSGNSMVRSSADQTTQADDGSLKARRPPPEEDADIKRACAADSQFVEKHTENFEQSDITQENHWNDYWALIPDCDGDLPLHVAVAKASETLVQKCVEIMHGFGVSVDRYNKKRKTPLHLAVISRQRLIVERLLRSYASPNVCDRNGDSSIHLAVKYRCVDCLKCLVTKSSHVIDLDTRNYEGLTAIHLAVLSDELELAEILLRVGATVDVADGKTGRMPLHCAIESDNKEMVKLLLAYGANPHAITYSGQTPAHIAKNHLEMADMLELTTYRLQKDKTQQDIFAHRRWKTGKSSRLRSEATRKCVWQC